MAKVALITGGASGIGLAVVQSFAANGWQVVVVDKTPHSPRHANASSALFIEADVSDYTSLRNAFVAAWKKYARLDFVFANAGIIERQSFYSPSDEDNKTGLPLPPDLSTIQVNLSGVIFTSHLALHFLRQSTRAQTKSLVLTCSSGGLYPVTSAPIYSAAKHGVLGFMRSISTRFYNEGGIRVNCICPGTTITDIIGPDEWALFPPECITTPRQVATVVQSIVDDPKRYGQAVEIVVDKTYCREAPPFLDNRMEKLTACTDGLLG